MKPTLLILAAGLGSRYGGMKQTVAFGPSGETITDYSIYDALKAGFGKIIFVISPQMEEDFQESYMKRFSKNINVDYVIQSIDAVPPGVEISPDRKKPWGTAHAVLMAQSKINEPFAVINADDFYGRSSYELVSNYLIAVQETDYYEYCLAGYPIANTLSEHGTVARGICKTDREGYLTGIWEKTKIHRKNGKIVNTEPDGSETELAEDTLVSMNMFGFSPSIFNYIEKYFDEFIREKSMDPKAEIYLPFVVHEMIKAGIARTKVLETDASWFGVTYQEDAPKVKEEISKLVRKGEYPQRLWS